MAKRKYVGRGMAAKAQQRTESRRSFTAKKQDRFFEALARTANAMESARIAKVGYSTIWHWRQKNAAFAERYRNALDEGYADLEMRLLAIARFGVTSEKLERLNADGGKSVSERRDDPRFGLMLLRAHRPDVLVHRAMTRPDAQPPVDPAELAIRIRAALIEVQAAGKTPALPTPADADATDRKDGGDDAGT